MVLEHNPYDAGLHIVSPPALSSIEPNSAVTHAELTCRSTATMSP